MIYRIRVVLDFKEDVIRDLEIDQNASFEDLHFTILKHFGLDNKELASFFISDENWTQGEEIFLQNYDENLNQMMMKNISLNSLSTRSMNYLYVYDYLKLWTFFIEIVEESKKILGENYPKKIYGYGSVPNEPPKKTFNSNLKNDDSEFNLDDEDDFLDFY